MLLHQIKGGVVLSCINSVTDGAKLIGHECFCTHCLNITLHFPVEQLSEKLYLLGRWAHSKIETYTKVKKKVI